MARAPSPPQFTTKTPGFTGCIDYIFHGESFRCVATRRVPPAEGLLGEALPSTSQPSDHLMLVADLIASDGKETEEASASVASIPYEQARFVQ